MAKLTGNVIEVHRTGRLSYTTRVYSSGLLVCTRCNESREKYHGRSRICMPCVDANRAAKHHIDPRSTMLWSARGRARRKGLQCTITLGDIVIPAHCPILGMPLKVKTGSRGHADHSPSLDRIDPKLGYTPANVQVISQLANIMKNSATLEQLEKLGQCAHEYAIRQRAYRPYKTANPLA
jgi:hypothetical protein